MKRKLIPAVCVLLVVLCIVYCTMTPLGALRLRILLSGYPMAALKPDLLPETNRMYLEPDQIGYSLGNPPFEWDTQAQLVNWVVTKRGLFYSARYYGWG